MTPDTERLIELASRPLADNAELQLASVAILQERLAEHAPSSDTVAEAIDALEQADRNPRRRHWRTGLYLAAFAAALAATIFSALPAYQAAKSVNGNIGVDDSSNSIERHTASLSPEQMLLMFGKEGAANEAGRWKPLWDSAPENPAFLAQYAAAYAFENGKFSPEILDAVERIDPNNGWYPALSAGWIMKDMVKAKPQTANEKKENKPKVWEINDKAKLGEALRLIHQAAEKPEFSSYESARLKQRISLLPPRTDWVSQFPPACYVASQHHFSFHLRNIAEALSAGAQECAANKDIEGFRRIVGDWQKLSTAMTRNGGTIVDLLVARACITTPLKNFSETAHGLGLEEEATRFVKLDETFLTEKEARKSSRHDWKLIDLAENRASMLASMSIPVTASQVNDPPSLTDADLRPSRYAEHAFLNRVTSASTWVLLAVFIGLAALCRFLKSTLVRTLSFRMADLLRTSDWLWIVLSGVLLPMLWYLSIIHLTPLGSREWSVRASGMVLPVGQFGALLLLVIISPLVIAGWRLGKRGAMFGLRSRFQWIGWLAAGLPSVAIPALGAVMLMPQTAMFDSLQMIAIAFFSIPAIWLMVVFSLNLFGRSEQSLRRATLAGLMIPVWTLGILAFAAWTPFLYTLECRWMKQDRLLEISADAPSLSRYEYDGTQVLRAEILDVVSRKP
ncbi:MAG: hypothetical protein WCS43_05045 [Verrucomicrobiota bacterium]